MSEIEKILEKHLGKPSIFLGVLNDLVYSMVLGVLIGEMKEVMKEEEEGLKQLKSDEEALIVGLQELKKLENLIIDLEEVAIPASMNIKNVIRQRYMK